jgi:hypothetical protein
MSRPRHYQRMLAVRRRAGVPDAHPHRCRDTSAMDMLARGASPYDLGKLLGDTVATVEKHYAPFVTELRDRARQFMENGEGLEIVSCGQRAIRRCAERRRDCADDEPADVVGGIPRCRGRMVSDVAVANMEWAGSGIPNAYHCRYGVFGCGAMRANSRLVVTGNLGSSPHISVSALG